MSLTSLMIVAGPLLAAETGHGEPAIHPYAVGGLTLGILLALLAVLVMFGGGREHS